jgi:hypothetical protein
MSANPRGLIIAAPASGSGKTTGAPAAERGSRRGAVTGSFFHVIDAAA